MGDPLAFCRARLPGLFAQTHAALGQRDGADDRPIGTRIRFSGDGGGEVGLVARGARLEVVEAADLPVFGYGLELPVEAAGYAVDRFDGGELSAEEVGATLAELSSAHARELFSDNSYAFDVTTTDVPVLGTVRSRVTLGHLDLDAPTEFSLEVEFDELEDAREQGTPPHQLFIRGKLKMDGDVAKAMLLGMTLAQLDEGRA